MSTEEFINRLFQKHQEAVNYPATSTVCNLMTKLLLLLYPEQSKKKIENVETLQTRFNNLEQELVEILQTMPSNWKASPEQTASNFMQTLPAIFSALNEDVEATLSGDPAAVDECEVIRAYPGFYAVAFYRFAHELYKMGVPLIPRVITEFAHSKTGIDIHPGAKIQPYFFIDHGTGVVIGETCEIGRNVKIYQGVTLGALSVSKDMAQTKRHPTVEEGVVIYSGTTILGGETVIGAHSMIGGNVWLTKSVPSHSKVYYQSETKVKLSTKN